MAQPPEDPEFDLVFHPDCVNHEAKNEPPASRGTGPEAMRATAVWLQQAYADLRWEIHEVVAKRDLVAVHCTMSGRHVGDFVSFDAAGAVADGRDVRDHADPLVPRRRRPDHRALGQPR
jgi:hypothetical protein